VKLLEAIIDANHRALAGDAQAGLHPGDYGDSLPLVALTCVDPRLNPLMPEVLGIPEEQFIWLRNAGNIITGSLSSTMRSLALACAVKGGKEIALIGHTNCQVGKTSMVELTDRFKALGIARAGLPENLTEFFGLFASERQNVMRGVDHVRQSPLIGPKVPVHGLLVDIQTGKLEWLVNGYDTLASVTARLPAGMNPTSPTLGTLESLADFKYGEMKFPESKIGEASTSVHEWISDVQGTQSASTPVGTEGHTHWKSDAQAPAGAELPRPATPAGARPAFQVEVRDFSRPAPSPPKLKAQPVKSVPVPPRVRPMPRPSKDRS
jgi:carbonic anhydrase